MAMTGMYGRIQEVEQVGMWDFFDALAYVRAQADFRSRLGQ